MPADIPYRFAACENFRKARKQFLAKRPHLKEILWNRLEEIRLNPRSHGKPLKYVGGNIWEAHFEKSFIILWTTNESKKAVVFLGLAHKDEYQKEVVAGRSSATREGLLASGSEDDETSE